MLIVALLVHVYGQKIPFRKREPLLDYKKLFSHESFCQEFDVFIQSLKDRTYPLVDLFNTEEFLELTRDWSIEECEEQKKNLV